MLEVVDGRRLEELAARVAAALPAVTEGQPFGVGTDVFKVVGKVFTLVGEHRGTSMVTVKCAPPHAAALVAGSASIIPGYHVDKRHWVTITPGNDVSEQLVEDLVGNSYDLVVLGLPARLRPLDPGSRRADAE